MSLSMKRMVAAMLPVCASVLSGCAGLEGATPQVAAITHQGHPPLSGQAQQWYQEVVARVQQGRGSAAIFDTTAALDCELSEDTQSLIAYQATADYVRLREHRDALVSKIPVPDGSLQVRVLAGQCQGGEMTGEFDAVTQYQSVRDLPTGGQQTLLISQRVQGVFVDGVLSGPLTTLRQVSSMIGGLMDVRHWSAYRADFVAGQVPGMELTYGEFATFSSTSVIRPLPTGLRRQEAFTGGMLSSRSDLYQGRIYGFMTSHLPGQDTSRTCHWASALAPDTLCQRLSALTTQSLLRTHVGVGLSLPPRAAGPFQVADVMYPGPAAKAGLLPGDLVMAIDRQLLTAQHDQTAIMALLAGETGSTVDVQFKRGQQSPQTVTITRGEFQSVVLPP